MNLYTAKTATLAVATALVLACCHPARAGTEVRMALTDPAGSTVYRAVSEVFKKRVEALTNGQVTVTLFPGSQLGTYKEELDKFVPVLSHHSMKASALLDPGIQSPESKASPIFTRMNWTSLRNGAAP